MTGQNDCQTQILSGQIVILARHCPVTGRYFESCIFTNVMFTSYGFQLFTVISTFINIFLSSQEKMKWKKDLRWMVPVSSTFQDLKIDGSF